MNYIFIKLIISFLINNCVSLSNEDLNEVWGPGLYPDKIIMPARYFFVKPQDIAPSNKSQEKLVIAINGDTKRQANCRIWTNILDRKDGSYIVRYKLHESCLNLNISITFDRRHLGKSPYITNKPVLSDNCYCPTQKIEDVLTSWECGPVPNLLKDKLETFGKIDWNKIRKRVIKKFDQPHAVSICHYIIKNNKIYRKCYGKYVGFNMFVDSILLSLTRKVIFPDIELFFNLGDWPLSLHNLNEKYPILSWCGSIDSYDIILPTYDITESTLENMGRVTLDLLSVQGNTDLPWNERIPKLFWRGRDSNKYRLELIKLAKKYPDLFNVSLTNFFFYKDEEATLGPKSEHISFFKFFDYKYQLAIDGTVAPYRMPYLLAGGSVVFKPDSKYFEFFYNDLEPYVHYIPVKKDITDLLDKLKWAIENEEKSKKIAANSKQFVNENLLPKNIFCYHLHVFNEIHKRTISKIEILEGMETIEQTRLENCDCKRVKDEL